MKANQHHLERLRQGGAHTWNMWRQSDPAILPDLQGADLSGAVLNWAQLDDALVSDEQLSTVKSWLGR